MQISLSWRNCFDNLRNSLQEERKRAGAPSSNKAKAKLIKTKSRIKGIVDLKGRVTLDVNFKKAKYDEYRIIAMQPSL